MCSNIWQCRKLCLPLHPVTRRKLVNKKGMTTRLYDMLMCLLYALMRIVHRGHRLWLKPGGKTHRFVMGQQGLLQHIADTFEGSDRPVCWVHASSLGEYGVARPVVTELSRQGMAVGLTFFSPTAYKVLKNRRDAADHVYYLPLDTRQNVCRFLDTVKPQRAVFIISEYWINYLHELRKREIPTFLVSALIPSTSYLLKWYAKPIRRALRAITTFMVLDKESQANLAKMGFSNCTVTGNPLFDNALQTAQTDYSNDVVERFVGSHEEVFVAGSITDEHDLDIVAGFANSHPEMKFIMVPHEISLELLSTIEQRCQGTSVRHSACQDHTSLDTAQILIIDFVGALARIYRYGKYAYVGGGFTKYLHSVIEPVVYGQPVSFGPNIQRKVTPRQMVSLGIGAVVTTADELEQWHSRVNGTHYDAVSRKAKDYARHNGGATATITKIIMR